VWEKRMKKRRRKRRKRREAETDLARFGVWREGRPEHLVFSTVAEPVGANRIAGGVPAREREREREGS
jgi:hypothetical protein